MTKFNHDFLGTVHNHGSKLVFNIQEFLNEIAAFEVDDDDLNYLYVNLEQFRDAIHKMIKLVEAQEEAIAEIEEVVDAPSTEN